MNISRRLAVMALAAIAACAEQRAPDAAATDAAATAAPATPRVPGPSATPVKSPDSYRVKFRTSKGDFTVAVQRALAPLGADRLYELVTAGYFADVRFFRVVPGFIIQFGMHGDPEVNASWEKAPIPDEPRRTSNTRGTFVFASAGADTRTVQLFINLADNGPKLDQQRMFFPFGSVVEGMDIVDKLNSEYGEEPNPSRIASQGNAYLQRWFPALDYITSASIESSAR